MSGFAKLLRSISPFREEPLVSPKSAKQIASKIVVFPAPVVPVMRKSPLPSNAEKSTVSTSAYGPKALIFSLIGFIVYPSDFFENSLNNFYGFGFNLFSVLHFIEIRK